MPRRQFPTEVASRPAVMCTSAASPRRSPSRKKLASACARAGDCARPRKPQAYRRVVTSAARRPLQKGGRPQRRDELRPPQPRDRVGVPVGPEAEAEHECEAIYEFAVRLEPVAVVLVHHDQTDALARGAPEPSALVDEGVLHVLLMCVHHEDDVLHGERADQRQPRGRPRRARLDPAADL